MMGALAKKLFGDGTKKFRTYVGDTAFLKAAAAIAANVTAADGKIEDAEIKASKKVMLANPIIKPSFDPSAIERELNAALDRAETRSGRHENAQIIKGVETRDQADRDALFLIGVDVADVGEVGEKEDAALTKIAELLLVDKAALMA